MEIELHDMDWDIGISRSPESLNDALVEYQSKYLLQKAELAALRQRLAELEAVLKPFADFFLAWDKYQDGLPYPERPEAGLYISPQTAKETGYVIMIHTDDVVHGEITYQHLKAARAALGEEAE